MSIRKTVTLALCSFASAFIIGAMIPVFANADGLNELYDQQEQIMVVNEEAGSAVCDHACLIISGFIGVGAMANAVISMFFLIYGCVQHEKVKEKIAVIRQSAERVDMLRREYPRGTRVLMEYMEDANPIEYGSTGKVELVDDLGTIHVSWDCGRNIGIIPGVDKFKKLDEPVKETEKGR